MFVRCINNHSGLNFLTINKVYYASIYNDNFYLIINDERYESTYRKSDFKLITKYKRKLYGKD